MNSGGNAHSFWVQVRPATIACGAAGEGRRLKLKGKAMPEPSIVNSTVYVVIIRRNEQSEPEVYQMPASHAWDC